jgi:putative SOS response-associated peptidase YedK
MCNLYSITTNQAAIIALFRVINRYVGNLPPMPGYFPDYPAPVVRNTETGTELVTMRWGMPSPRTGGPPVTNIQQHVVTALARMAQAREPLLGASEQLCRVRTKAEP